MRQFGSPESDRPAQRGRRGRVRDDDQHLPGPRRHEIHAHVVIFDNRALIRCHRNSSFRSAPAKRYFPAPGRTSARCCTTTSAACRCRRRRGKVAGVMPDSGLELRQLRTFAAVAQRRSFTRAAEDLHIAQQAVSQQIKALERSLGVTLLRRTPRRVELTAEGSVFLADCRRVLAAADRAARRVRAAARGEVGTLRLAYTLTTVWDTLPKLLGRLNQVHPQVKIEAREVFGADIPELLLAGRYDFALAPRTSYPAGFHSRTIRREPLRVALSTAEPLARRKRIDLATLADRLFEIWPRDMAPGFYDTVVGTCRTAGFEPQLDEQ